MRSVDRKIRKTPGVDGMIVEVQGIDVNMKKQGVDGKTSKTPGNGGK